MKCPVCGAWSNVLDTRTGPFEAVKRRRECGNGHRFVTLEVIPTVIHKPTAAASLRAASTRRRLWSRDVSIRSDPRTAREIGAELGLHPKQVQRIRAGTRR